MLSRILQAHNASHYYTQAATTYQGRTASP